MTVLGLIGVAAGVIAKLSDLVPGGWFADLTTFGAVWVVVLALLGRLDSRPARAAGAAASIFISMLAAYYGMTLVVLHYPVTVRLVLAWAVAAVTVCPAVAAVLALAYRSGRGRAGVLIGVAAALVFVDGTLQRLRLVLDQPDLAAGARPVQAVFDVLAALIISAVLPRRSRTRVVAVVTTIGAAVFLIPLLEQSHLLGVFG